jgi:hypothetical protein
MESAGEVCRQVRVRLEMGGQRRERRLGMGPSAAPTDRWEVESHVGSAAGDWPCSLYATSALRCRSIGFDIGAGDVGRRNLDVSEVLRTPVRDKKVLEARQDC